MSLRLVPVDRDTAIDFIRRHHRHNEPSFQWKFGVGVEDASGELVGVAIAGRPVAKALDTGFTVEILRCCTDGARNASSRLYGALCRAAFALGYTKVITYTLAQEPGISLLAAGFENEAITKGGSWSRKRRPRVDKAPTCPKHRWAKEKP